MIAQCMDDASAQEAAQMGPAASRGDRRLPPALQPAPVPRPTPL